MDRCRCSRIRPAGSRHSASARGGEQHDSPGPDRMRRARKRGGRQCHELAFRTGRAVCHGRRRRRPADRGPQSPLRAVRRPGRRAQGTTIRRLRRLQESHRLPRPQRRGHGDQFCLRPLPAAGVRREEGGERLHGEIVRARRAGLAAVDPVPARKPRRRTSRSLPACSAATA